MTRNDLLNFFWGNLDAELSAKGLDYTSLSQKSGISYKTLTGWKCKNRLPNVESLISIAGVLDCSIDFLVNHRTSNRWESYIEALEKASSKELRIVRSVLDIELNEKDSASEAGRKLG